MRTLIPFLLIWFVVVDAFNLPEIVENAEEEIMQEMKDYNARINPMKKLYKSRKVTKAYVDKFLSQILNMIII